MIDTNKYEGHATVFHVVIKSIDSEVVDRRKNEGRQKRIATYALLNDAPLLLEEVKRLRGLLIKGSKDYTTSYMDLRKIIEDVHWELTGDDHETNEERIKHALIALSEVIG